MKRTLLERARTAKARRRADGTWEIRLVLTPGAKQRSFYGRTEDEARAELIEAVRAQERTGDYRAGQETVTAWLTRWLAYERPRMSYAAWRRHRNNIEKHIGPAIGRMALVDVRVGHVQVFLDSKAGAYAKASIVQMRTTLSAAFAEAVRLEIVTDNPVTRSRTPPSARTARDEPVMPTPENARALLTAMQDDRLAPLYYLCFACGLRQGEALALRWRDIDLTTGTIRVRHSLRREPGRFVLAPPKTGRTRTVIAPPFVVSALVAWRARQGAERRRPAADWRWMRGDAREPWWDELVFTTPAGAPYHAELPRRLLKRYIADFRFHDTRHFAASLLLALGVQPRYIMDSLGHASLTMTHHYQHMWQETREHVAALVEDALAPVEKG